MSFAEQLRVLLGVGVTADPCQQASVVGRVALHRVGADQVGEPHRDQARAQHVFQRLPEAQVDGERERGQQLSTPRPTGATGAMSTSQR